VCVEIYVYISKNQGRRVGVSAPHVSQGQLTRKVVLCRVNSVGPFLLNKFSGPLSVMAQTGHLPHSSPLKINMNLYSVYTETHRQYTFRP
jgi:hypothetical protein